MKNFSKHYVQRHFVNIYFLTENRLKKQTTGWRIPDRGFLKICLTQECAWYFFWNKNQLENF